MHRGPGRGPGLSPGTSAAAQHAAADLPATSAATDLRSARAIQSTTDAAIPAAAADDVPVHRRDHVLQLGCEDGLDA